MRKWFDKVERVASDAVRADRQVPYQGATGFAVDNLGIAFPRVEAILGYGRNRLAVKKKNLRA